MNIPVRCCYEDIVYANGNFRALWVYRNSFYLSIVFKNNFYEGAVMEGNELKKIYLQEFLQEGVKTTENCMFILINVFNILCEIISV